MFETRFTKKYYQTLENGHHEKIGPSKWTSKRHIDEVKIRKEKRELFHRERHTKATWQLFCRFFRNGNCNAELSEKQLKRLSNICAARKF